MKKIYVSLPMGGHEKTVRHRYDKAALEIANLNESYELAAPFNINEFDENGIKQDREHDWAYYMGRDIETLLRCDAIYVTRGFKNSPGCRVELAVAIERDMHIILAPDASESL